MDEILILFKSTTEFLVIILGSGFHSIFNQYLFALLSIVLSNVISRTILNGSVITSFQIYQLDLKLK